MLSKPKFRKGGTPADASKDTPQLTFAGVPDIVEIKEQTWGSIIAGWIKSIILFVLLVGLVLLAVYSALAATVLYVSSVDGKLAMVARGTFVGGVPEQGNKILISTTDPAPTEILDKLKVGFMGAANPAIYTVLSKTAYDTISVSNNVITVGDKPVEGTFFDLSTGEAVPNMAQQRLDNQVVISCLGGDCEPGTVSIVSPDFIYGEVKPFKVGL